MGKIVHNTVFKNLSEFVVIIKGVKLIVVDAFLDKGVWDVMLNYHKYKSPAIF